MEHDEAAAVTAGTSEQLAAAGPPRNLASYSPGGVFGRFKFPYIEDASTYHLSIGTHNEKGEGYLPEAQDSPPSGKDNSQGSAWSRGSAAQGAFSQSGIAPPL